MDLQEDIFAQQVAHLVKLARAPGFWRYAMRRVLELESDKSGLFRGILPEVESQLEALQCQSSEQEREWFKTQKERMPRA